MARSTSVLTLSGNPAITAEGLGRSFTTALLLTQSAQRAEEAVLSCISQIDPLTASNESLLRETVAASIHAKAPEDHAQDQERAAAMLPIELQRVLRLPMQLRWAFVLRILVGMPREAVAMALQTGNQQIDQFVCDSAKTLAGPQFASIGARGVLEMRNYK